MSREREIMETETLAFDAAVRRLMADGLWNFREFRGAIRDGAGPVIVNFDGTFAVEGALDAYVHLLDYSVPAARLVFYRGDDAAAARVVYEAYTEKLASFAARLPGTISRQVDDDPRFSTQIWTSISFETDGPRIGAYHLECPDVGKNGDQFSVWVEIDALAVETIEGSPDDSPWRIVLGE